MDGAHAGDEPVAHATEVPNVLENTVQSTDAKDTSTAQAETRVDAPTMPDPNTDAAPNAPEAQSDAPEAKNPAPVNEGGRTAPESDAGKEATSQSVAGPESEGAPAEAPAEAATESRAEQAQPVTEDAPAHEEPMQDAQDAPHEPTQGASSAAPTMDNEPASKPDEAPKEDVPKKDVPKEDTVTKSVPKEDTPKEDTATENASKEDVPNESASKEDTPKDDTNSGKTDASKSKPTEPTRPKSRRVALLTQPLGTPVERTEAPAPTDSEADKGSESDADRSGESDSENPTETEEEGAEAADKSAEAMDEDSSDSEEDDTGSASRKRPRSPSPEEDEPESVYSGPPPRPTIRLEVEVHPGGSSKSDYIIPVPKLSVSRMQSKYPKWAAWYSATHLESESSHASYQPVGLSEQELENLGGLAKLLQKYPTQGTSGNPRKRRADEYDVGSYDTKDPFVDDSELGMDEPTHIVKTRSDGFYVALGPVELARAKMTRPSSRSESAFRSSIGSLGAREGWAGYARQTNKLLAKRAASKKGQGPRTDKAESEAAPTPPADGTPSEPEPAPPRPVPEPKPAAEPSPPASRRDKAEKKKNKYPVQPVHPQLQSMFDHLKTLVQRASFAVKTKFPPELKPPLIDTAKLAVELDEYNENFFNYLPSIFPYNRFTMMVCRLPNPEIDETRVFPQAHGVLSRAAGRTP